MALFKKDRLLEILDQQAAKQKARVYHLLLVDDEPDNLKVLSELLSEEYFVHQAESGAAGLEIMKTRPVDLVISDQRMPEMTGVEFLSQSLTVMPYCIRLILTGYTDVDAIIMAINEGRVYRYLTKPWDTRELLITIRRALEAYESERKSRRKSEFLARTSHELRTPLNAIIGYSEILKEQAEELGQVDTTSDLEKIRSSAWHVLGLVNELLDLSRIESGKMELFPQTFDVATLARDVLPLVAPLAGKNGNELKLVLAEDLGLMTSDLVKIRQCLFNLLSNASKFTKDGTVTLGVTRESRHSGDFVVFKVSDTGIGITEEQRARVFQAYEQAEASTQATYGGTGLGLAITRQFCLLMKGDVGVDSVPGKGTTFTMRLPAELALEERPRS